MSTRPSTPLWKSVLVLIAAVFVFRSSVLQFWVVPSGSMLPTLKINDRILVNRLQYGLMPPFFESLVLQWSTPRRGDIVVFRSPADDYTIMVKRVVGVGGDTIRFQSGKLVVNDSPVMEEPLSDRTLLFRMSRDDSGEGKSLLLEHLQGQPPHRVLRYPEGATASEEGVWEVPPGKILCLGDNRDASRDGRHWGFVDTRHLYGKVSFVLYSTYDDTKGIWPSFRHERWLHPVE